LRPGELIAGKYRVLRVVRSGGVGVVFRAEALADRRPVALKIMNIAQAHGDLRARIEREIEILGRLDHPHVVKCFDAGPLPGDRMYLALEWLEGRDLSEQRAQEALTLKQILVLLIQLSDALDAAHGAGVVHRDIKPANIYLMRRRGREVDARLIDFGVAKLPETSSALTRAGAILGTPSYMAPEQASQAMDVDGRSDIFSLGVVAYELVVGRLPWQSATDLARLAHILVEAPVPMHDVNPEVPEPVVNLVAGMLENDLGARIQSAAAVRDIAQTCLDVLSPAELDATYVADARPLGTVARADTVDLPPLAPEPGLDPSAPSVRFRSVVKTGADLQAGLLPLDEHDETVELSKSALEADLRGEAARPLAEAPGLSAAEALEAVTGDELPAVSLAAVDEVGFGGLLSYVDHMPTAMLYGRVASLERLERRASRALSLAQPNLTLVIGPAGIGKTRVRTELARLVRGRRSPPRVFAGRAEESFRTTPYAFLRRMLFAEAQVHSDDDDEAMRAKVLRLVPRVEAVRQILGALEAQDALDALTPGAADPRTAFMSPELMEKLGPEAGAEEDRAVIAAFLCEALGIAYPDIPPVVAARHAPGLLGQQMRRALDVVLRALAEETGLVILVDDAHLLDRQSAQILFGLTDPEQRARAAVVAFALPTLVDTDSRGASPLSAHRDDLETVELGPLEPRASREMARSLVRGAVQSDTLERLVQRAAGNPLYLEQLVRAVQASGVLEVGADGEFVLGPDAQDGERVPPTVAASVSVRLSFLEPRLQRVLTAAAVFGEVFWVEGVARLVERPEEEVLMDLDRLLMAGLVRRRPVSRYRGETELEFVHAVVRSVALSRLKRRRRADFEGRAAAYLEARGEADLAVIARHVAQAGLHARAAELYTKSAARALLLGDPGSAGLLAEEGLRMVDELEDAPPRVALLEILEQVALARGDWEGGRDVMDALSDLVEGPRAVAQVYLRRSRLAAMARRFEEARVEAQEAERAFSALGDGVEVARAQLLFAEAAEALGDGRGALRGYLAAHVGLGAEGASKELAESSRGLARVAVASGDYKNAENRFRSALVASRTVRDYGGLFTAELGLAEVHRAMGDQEAARSFLDEALRVAFDRGQRLTVRVAQVALLLEDERFDDAHARLDRLHVAAEQAGLRAVRRRAALVQGQTFRRRPALDAALRERRADLATVGLRLAQAMDEAVTDDPSLVAALELAAAVVSALEGAGARALTLAHQAQARFQTQGALSGEEPPAVYYSVARVHQLVDGDAGEARTWLKRAVAQVDAIGSRLERRQRARYLQRPLARAVLEEAERAGVPVARDAMSNRISAEDA
jgi:serine/threonine protein kinase/tetratricopeptide (TPR) repeat protein